MAKEAYHSHALLVSQCNSDEEEEENEEKDLQEKEDVEEKGD